VDSRCAVGPLCAQAGVHTRWARAAAAADAGRGAAGPDSRGLAWGGGEARVAPGELGSLSGPLAGLLAAGLAPAGAGAEERVRAGGAAEPAASTRVCTPAPAHTPLPRAGSMFCPALPSPPQGLAELRTLLALVDSRPRVPPLLPGAAFAGQAADALQGALAAAGLRGLPEPLRPGEAGEQAGAAGLLGATLGSRPGGGGHMLGSAGAPPADKRARLAERGPEPALRLPAPPPGMAWPPPRPGAALEPLAWPGGALQGLAALAGGPGPLVAADGPPGLGGGAPPVPKGVSASLAELYARGVPSLEGMAGLRRGGAGEPRPEAGLWGLGGEALAARQLRALQEGRGALEEPWQAAARGAGPSAKPKAQEGPE
jgi:hypothetical protein